jgi:cellulase/cellobiase CelA1
VNNFSVTTDGSTNPPVTPTPTPTPTPTVTTPPPNGSGCTATLKVDNSWNGGMQGTVTVKNAGSSMISSWTVKGTLPSGTTISNLWSGVLTTSGSAITVKNAPYNGLLNGGASTTFGFVSNGNAAPTGFTCSTP